MSRSPIDDARGLALASAVMAGIGLSSKDAADAQTCWAVTLLYVQPMPTMIDSQASSSMWDK